MELSNNKSGPFEHLKKFLFPVKKVKFSSPPVKLDNKLIFLGHEEKRASELILANKELAFQNKEKEKRAAELFIANKELLFQNEEKENRAAELIIANKELAYQNEEKENRAAELIIANKELAYQNEEKEKRAAELIIANKELAYQNKEKEKRAAELIVANKELAFQNKEKEKRAAELLILNQELEAFSYSISHDLRAPLRAIIGYSAMIKERVGNQPDVETDRLINNVVTNGKKMRSLIDDLLTFSRLGRKDLVMNTISINDMVTGISREMNNDQELRDIEFEIKPLISAQADHIAIKQVWINLIANAIKYTKFKEKAIIQISSEIKEDEIIYCIKDNGAGFNMKYSNKLFGVFQRLHSEDEFEGTGVGLAIVYRIITKHGGRVWAHGVENEGATFYFTLKHIFNDRWSPDTISRR